MSVGSRQLVTILAPAYNEAENVVGLVDFFREIRSAHPDLDFELVVVDDGSVDGTADLFAAALGPGDVARVARLSRNFGSHAAITAGLALCRGDCLITVSTDLQEPLEAIGRFIAEWQSGADIVWGVRRTRSVRGMGNLMSRLFSRVFNRLSEIPTYPKEGPSQVLVSRPVIDAVNAMPERNRNVLGIVAWVGFTQHTIAFDQLPRPAGQSKWTSRKKIRLLVDSFVEFCPAPFMMTMLAGMVLSVLGVLAAVVQAVVALATGAGPSGWGMVLAGMFFLGGLQLGAIGGFGEYLWRAGDDSRRRPVYLLRCVHDVGTPARDHEPVQQGAYEVVGATNRP